MPRTSLGHLLDYGVAQVPLNADGDGSVSVSFAETFVAVPQVVLVERASDSGALSASAVTTTSFTLSVIASDLTDTTIRVRWMATEKD